MKICVLGFDGGAPQVVFRDERLVNIRRLMDAGVYGLLESVVPPDSIPAWAGFSTSQDPGSLGVYGNRNRASHSYEAPMSENSSIIDAPAIWDHLEEKGKRSIIAGVPRNYPPRRAKDTLTRFLGDYPFDVKFSPASATDQLKGEIFDMSRKQWQAARSLVAEQEWDYFQFVDMGVDRLQHALWKDFDEKHIGFNADNSDRDTIPDYYQWLDEQVGAVFELIDDQTIVLVVSAHGAQRLDGVFAINQWLISEGLLVLHEYPSTPTPFEELEVDWSKTKVWSEDGSYARLFFNVQGREPQGILPSEQRDVFLEELKHRLQTLTDKEGQPLQNLVFKPQDIYRDVRNVAPDLMVALGGLFWRAVDSVGHPSVYLNEGEIGSDGCNHAEYGFFILAAPNCPLQGEYEGARLLDMAPTLLDLAGYDIAQSMQGKSLVAGMEKKAASGGPDDGEAQRLIQDRLAGLGYI